MLACLQRGGNVKCRGKGIVGGLTHIDMVIGMNGLLLPSFPQKHAGMVGDHFIDIHIALCP